MDKGDYLSLLSQSFLHSRDFTVWVCGDVHVVGL